MASGLGFLNLLGKTQHALKTLLVPTILGSVAGAYLLLTTSNAAFRVVVPGLILLASLLLFFQPRIKAMVGHSRRLPTWVGMLLQFVVAAYGGYFGAGMGIMMLACFALYIDGTVHELNGVKNFLAVVINIVCSGIFFLQRGLVLPMPALALMIGGVIGGFVAARVSQRIHPDRLRPVIAVYGFVMAGYFAWRAFGLGA